MYIYLVFKQLSLINGNNYNNYSINSYNIYSDLLKKKNKLFSYYNNSIYLNSYMFNIHIYNKHNSQKKLRISNYNLKYLYYFLYNNKVNHLIKLNGLNSYNNSIHQFDFFFIKFFMYTFLLKFFNKKKLMFKLQKVQYKELISLNSLKKIFNKVRHLKFFKELQIFSKNFVYLLLVILNTKDTTLFKNTLKYSLEKLYFKDHRKFLVMLKYLLKQIFLSFSTYFKLNGIYLKIKGKIGVGGNLKKRKFNFKIGSFSFTNKIQKLNYNKSVVRTHSGVLGVELYIAYK